MIDLRSDTVTRPTKEMLEAMNKAEVGDDVFAEDPSAIAFQQKMAGLFGMEAGLFVPSGTMSNQLCLNVLTETGDEVIAHETAHIFNYESTSAGWLSNIHIRPISKIKGDRGLISAHQVSAYVRTRNEWDPWSAVLALENTTNKGGGACYSKENLVALKKTADQENLKIHIDGARIWNAMTVTGIEPAVFGEIADTMSICFSKGLGAPVGSMMLGTKEMISKARRIRKMLGGGMRQIGLLTSACDYAVENHWPLMQEDHRRAKELEKLLKSKDGVNVPAQVESNILIFNSDRNSLEVVKELAKHGVKVVPFGPKDVRVTYHFQVSEEDHQKVIEVFDLVF
jgi:threonine aldolase